jgi:hypothetical protein
MSKKIGIFINKFQDIKSFTEELVLFVNEAQGPEIYFVYPEQFLGGDSIPMNDFGILSMAINSPMVRELDSILFFENMKPSKTVISFVENRTVVEPVIALSTDNFWDEPRYISNRRFTNRYAFTFKVPSVLIVPSTNRELLEMQVPVTNLSETIFRATFFSKSQSGGVTQE